MFFFLPSGKRRRQESFIRKCWRQDELLRKRPKRRKYLILPIINKKNYLHWRELHLKLVQSRTGQIMYYVRIALWLMYVCRALLKSLVPAYMYVNRVFHRLLVRKQFESGKRKYCLRKSPGKAPNFPSKTLFEPCLGCGYYFCFSWVSAQQSVNCNYLRD